VVAPCWLTAILPTYNGARYLVHVLDSIVNQADPSIEVVAVDDGSTDDTLAILDRYRSQLPLRVVKQSHRGNWVASTNVGLALAQGRYACFLHQDDRWEPGRSNAVREAMRTDSPMLVLHAAWFIDETGLRLGQWRCPLPAGASLPGDLVIERLLVQNFVPIPSPVFPREAALAVGGLDETLWYTADWDFWLRLASLGSIHYISAPLVAFRIHAASQTARRSRDSSAFRHQLEIVLDRHLPAWEARNFGQECVTRAARFSVEVNVALAALHHGERPAWGRLVRVAARLGLRGWWRFLRDSRVVERVLPRLRLACRRIASVSRVLAHP
jgi:GT2 family glycosyltransferase